MLPLVLLGSLLVAASTALVSNLVLAGHASLIPGKPRVSLLLGIVPVLLFLPFWVVILVAALVAGVVLFPRILSARRRRVEGKGCLQDLPTLADALVLGIEAGQSLLPALLDARDVLNPRGFLAREIGRMEERIALGQPQTESLEEMGRTLPDARTQAFLETLVQSLRLGTPLAKVLREQSRLVREHLLLEAEQHANTLSLRLLFPLFLFILPSAFVLIISPVLLAILEAPPW